MSENKDKESSKPKPNAETTGKNAEQTIEPTSKPSSSTVLPEPMLMFIQEMKHVPSEGNKIIKHGRAENKSSSTSSKEIPSDKSVDSE